MRVISLFVSFFILINLVDALSFREVAVIPSGAMERGFGFDTDHDDKQNLVFCSPVGSMQFWEHIGFDRYILEDTAQWSQLYDVGYLDSDSLVDMVGNRNGVWPWPLYVYESPTPNTNPINIVWQDSGFMNISGGYITDLDQDGLREILFGYYDFEGPRSCVYENTGDNQYLLVWQDTLNAFYAAGANGDFDMDNRMEFIAPLGGYPSHILIWECYGDNEYNPVYYGTLPSPNVVEVFRGNDMDGNSKPEFLCTCVSYLYGIAWLYLYETIGDNNYDFFLVDSITGLPIDIGTQLSACGDIDADGKEEIIWSTFNQWHVYKATGVHQYQKIYSSAWTTHDITVMSVYDLNGNGYPEVIESWQENTIPYSHGTTIWEIEGVRLKTFDGYDIYHPGEVHPIIWQKFDPPGADSFSIFFSSDSGVTYDTIVTGLGADDTVYMWTIPDVISENCKIMIWAYGPPRPGEQQPRGVAWDISLNVFAIRPQPGIEVDTKYRIKDYILKISPNPFQNHCVIKFEIRNPKSETNPNSQIPNSKLQIYDATGRLVRQWDYQTIRLSDQIVWDGTDDSGRQLPDGIYFVELKSVSGMITEKVILVH